MSIHLASRWLLMLCFSLLSLHLFSQTKYHNDWTYLAIDSTKQKWGDWAEPDWLRYFGLDVGDVNRDGCLDIISGRYVYHNPCGTMDTPWSRTVLDDNVDAILFMDVDGDPYADIIAQALPNIYWLEAIDEAGTRYRSRIIGQVPATSHVNSQGFEKGQVIAGGKEEILIAGNGDIYCIQIPEVAPDTATWTVQLIGANTSDEGIGLGDIDGDGDLDVAAGRRPEGEDEPKILVWFENPGTTESAWKDRVVGKSVHPIDRVEVADVNGDQRADIIVTEERYPGLEPDGHFYWFENGAADWTKHTIVTQYSMNNLDIADLDHDGDIDLVTNEHKGEKLELQLWKNDGKGNFSKQVLDQGKENHLGTQLADLDGDGDLDIYGAAWDNYRWMHVWRNEALQAPRPGAVFREYAWIPTMAGDDGKFLRVGGKFDYRTSGEHFPTELHRDGFIELGHTLDLDQATRATLTLERVQSHEDTKNLSVQINNSPWWMVPDPNRIPAPATDYMFHTYPTIPVDLSHLKAGDDNVFRLRVDTGQAWGWPQNLIYGLTLRVYYDDKKPTFPANIAGIASGAKLSEEVNLSITSPRSTDIARVDYIGYYEDINWQGDGVYRQWQYHPHRGTIRNHIGSSTQAPFAVTWNTAWLPDQDQPIRLMAKITTKDGWIHWTEVIDNLQLDRPHAVFLVKPYGQPSHWVTRNGEHTAHFQLPFDPALATAAQLYWKSWSPCYSEGVNLNGQLLKARTDMPCYEYYEHRDTLVDLSVLRAGENTLITQKTPLYDGQMVHGMEVQYPGLMLKVKYAKPEATSSVQVSETLYEDRPHFVISTPAATYYYDRAGGGFSRMIDPAGNDWIAFKKEPWNEYPASAASAYRGLPNLVFKSDDGGAGHPGFDQCTSAWDGEKLITKSKSGKWQWHWTFDDQGAVLTVDKVDPATPYWFLYEGTPGGKYDIANYYYGTDQSGPIQKQPGYYEGTASYAPIRWVYVGHKEQDRVLYLAQVQKDQKVDLISYLGNSEKGLASEDGMTVFGFGRGPEAQPLLTGKQQFVLGFFDQQIANAADHQTIQEFLSAIIKNHTK